MIERIAAIGGLLLFWGLLAWEFGYDAGRWRWGGRA